MLARRTTERIVARDPAHWHVSIRRNDGFWLTRPEPEPGTGPGNAETWTRRFADVWHFDDRETARRAAIAHGCDPDGFTIHWIPNRGGEWLKGEGAYGPKPVSRPSPATI